MPIDVSIVVVSYHVRDYTLACLDSVRAHAGRCSTETILVDNASRDGTVEAVRARFPEVRLIENDANLGFTVANNQGIRVSAGRYVLLLNSDAEVRDGSLEAMLAHMDAHPDVGILGPRLVYADDSHQLSVNPFPTAWGTMTQFLMLARLFPESRWFAPHRHALVPRDFPRATDVDWVSGACILARRTTLEEIGLLDETFFIYYEETDLCRRARDAGWRVVYEPATTVLHHGQKTTSQNRPFFLEHSQQSLVHYFVKHGSLVQREVVRGIVILNALLRIAVSKVRWWIRRETMDQDRIRACKKVLGRALGRDPGPRVPPVAPPQSNGHPSVGVIVPTYRRTWDQARDTLEALARQSPPAAEVIIVDQTPDPDPRIARFAAETPSFRYVHIDTPGLPNARNVGAREATAEVVAYCDDDAVPVRGWVGAHAWRYRNLAVVAVVGRVVIPGRGRGRPAPSRVGSFRAFDADFVDNYAATFPAEAHSLTGCNMSVRRAALLAVGGFRTEYGGTSHLEETDVSLRLLRHGGRIVFEPSAEVEHRVAQTGGCRAPDRTRWAYWYARNYVLLYCTHFAGPGAWPFVAQRVARLLLFAWEDSGPGPLFAGLRGMMDGLMAHRFLAASTRDVPRFDGARAQAPGRRPPGVPSPHGRTLP